MSYVGSALDHYANKNNILINKLGIQTKDEFEKVERMTVPKNTISLHDNPINGNFDLESLEMLFLRNYLVIFTIWAEQLRDIDMS